MLIRKAYKFRLKTNPALEQKLFRQAGCCRWVWNQVWWMNQRRLADKQRIIRYHEAAFWLSLWKQSEEYGFLREAHSQPLQQTLKDLDRAYRDGFDKNQPLKRLPRKKRKFRQAAFRYPQGVKLDNRRIYLPKLGWVGFFKSRDISGTVKNATVSYQAGHWYVSVQVEQALPERVHPSTTDVGVDLGVANFAALSNGITYDPINAYRKYQDQLARAQRALSRKVKCSANWRKQKRKIQQLHHKIACCRFVRQLDYKLDWRGWMLIKVPPHYTSQTCSVCGHVSPANRPTQAVFHCQACGHTEHADTNAAKNIRARGHRVLACGGRVQSDCPVKQEPVGSREAVPPTTSTEGAGIPVL
ncbi:RNA-guided endonuclease InsQ/TnpB family protein [Thiolapillus sp.]|uniref:RNA-guided endonuclease InsQ/TnpB family protein n=1 Tax=Thiolapillus sp. TaxID=2017437 RepID=UPI003AF88187